MRPAEFTSESIIQAGLELQASGRNITGFALRQKVGGGNPSRLRQIWDEHLSSQSVTKVEPVADLPVEVAEEVALVSKELTQRLGALAVELNDKAVKAAERRVHEVVRSAGEQRAQAERELADASSTVDDLEDALDKARTELEMASLKFLELQGVAQGQAVELAQVRERLVASETAARGASEQHEAVCKRHTLEIEQLRSELADQKRISAGVLAERDQFRADMAVGVARVEAIERVRLEQKAAAEQEALRVAKRQAKAEADQDKSRQEAMAAREEVANLRGQLEAMKNQVADLMQALAGKPVVA